MMKTVLFHDDGTSPERSTQLSESKQYNQKFVQLHMLAISYILHVLFYGGVHGGQRGTRSGLHLGETKLNDSGQPVGLKRSLTYFDGSTRPVTVEHVLHKCLVARDHMATPDRKADQ